MALDLRSLRNELTSTVFYEAPIWAQERGVLLKHPKLAARCGEVFQRILHVLIPAAPGGADARMFGELPESNCISDFLCFLPERGIPVSRAIALFTPDGEKIRMVTHLYGDLAKDELLQERLSGLLRF